MNEQQNNVITEQEYSDTATQRTIIDLIDAESGEFIDANTLLNSMSEAELTRLKEVQSLAKKSGRYKYVCAVCGQPLRLDSRHYASRQYESYFFSHYSNGDDCPLKISSDAVDPIRSTINWYGKFKESKLHKDMCHKLMQVLSKDERFGNIESYPTIKIYGENVHWHKPDMASNFCGNQLVFETLIYNTFLSSIVEKNSFYRMANSFLLWVFPYFSIDNQTMCEKDVYYTHRRNIFVFDSEDYYRTDDNEISKPHKPVFAEKGYVYAQEESKRRGRLMLNCYWQIPVIQGEEVKIEWHHKLVDISDLTFDAIKKDVFFHNCDYDFNEVANPQKRELIENWERAKEARWNKIFQGINDRKKRFEEAQNRKNSREMKEDIWSKVLSGDVVPEPIKSEDKYGYKVDDITLIKPQYAKAFPFRNGYAFVMNMRQKIGLINLRNERIFDIKYDRLLWIDRDNPNILLCRENSGDQYDLYTVHGEKVLDYQIKDCIKINGNIIFKKHPDATWGVISSDGNVVAEPLYDKISANGDDKYIFKFAGRTKTVLSDLSNVNTKKISEVFPGKFIAERLLLWGIVDENGEGVLPFKYSKIEKYSEHYLCVEETNNGKKRYGLMDDNLKFVLPLDSAEIVKLPNGCFLRNGTLYKSDLTIILKGYDSIELCPNGNYIISHKVKNGWNYSCKYGISDESGNIIFPCISSVIVKNKEGNIDVSIEKLETGGYIKNYLDLFVLYNKEGKLLTYKQCDNMKPLPNGNILVTNKGRKGIIDPAGNEIVKCIYEHLELTESGDVGTTFFPIDDYCGKSLYLDLYALCDSTGNCITNYQYEDICCLTKGFYLAKKDRDKWLFDKSGNTIYTSSCGEEFIVLNQELIKVSNGVKNGVINTKGEIIVPVEYSTVEILPNENIKVTKIDIGINPQGQSKILHGLYKNDGSVIVECKYSALFTDSEGNLCPLYERLKDDFFVVHQMDKYALANSKKEFLTDFLYDSIKVFNDNFFLVEIEGEIGLIDINGRVVLSNVPSDNIIVECFTGNEFIISRGNDKGVVDYQGFQIIPQQFSDIVKLPNNTWKVEKSTHHGYYGSQEKFYGIYKKNGEILYDCIYQELVTDEKGNIMPTFHSSGDNVYKARLLDKYALCSEGKSILTDFIYDDILNMGSNFFIVKSGSEQGVIDLYGNVLLPLTNKEITAVIDGSHFVIKRCASNYLGSGARYLYDIIDNMGNIMFSSDLPIKLNDRNQIVIKTYLYFGDVVVNECSGKYAIGKDSEITLSDYVYDSVEKLNESLVIVNKSSKYGIVNSEGKLILPIEYSSEFESLSLGVVKFCKQDSCNKQYGLCDSSGRVLAEPIYSFIRENSPGHFKLFYKDGKEQKSKFLDIVGKNKFVVGQTYSGIVSGIKGYGIFVNVYGYGSGLVHIKQIIKKGKDIESFTKGETISVSVINVKKDGNVEFELN